MRTLHGLWGGWARFVVVAYVALYVLLDWASLVGPVSPLGITPWNPPAGLSFALLLTFGARFMPAVFVAVVLADLLFRDVGAAPWAVGVSAAVIAGGYGAASLLLRRRLRMALALDRRNDLIALFGVALSAATAVAPAVVAIFCAAGLLAWSDFTEFALRFWVGDVLGIVVLAPFLLLLFAGPRRWPALVRPGTVIEYGLQLAAIGLGLWIIFGLEPANHFEFSYVLFLPLIWIALRDGLVGAAWGIVATQLGVIAAIQVKGFDAETVTQFQFLMLAVAVTGFFLGSVVDERQRAESNLRDSEARLQTVVSTAPDAILTFEESGRITSVNRAAGEMFGAGARSLTGGQLASILPEIGSGAALRGGTETTARRTDGGTFAAEVSVGRADIAGRTLNVAVVRDITERKRAETALQQHEAQLAHAARLMAAGEMAAGLAHELNQPLTATISFARACEEVLKASGDDARREAAGLIGEAVQQALRAGEIIRRTREFLRRGDLRPRAIGADQLLRTSIDLVRAELTLQEINVSAEVAPGLAPVFADPIQIEQVILNLLRNSVEAIASTESGARQILLKAGPSRSEGEMIEFAILDTGPGLPPEIAHRLFTPFATTKERGMGLGLSISRSIIETHGGKIWAISRAPGAGVEIRFTLPAYSDYDDARDES